MAQGDSFPHQLSQDEVEQYGFQFGPMQVQRLAHVKGTGWWLRVMTPAGVVNIRASEKGQVMTANYRDWTKHEKARAREA